MSLDIRSADPADAAGLFGLIVAHAAFEGGETLITPNALDAILRASMPEVRIIVAADGDRIVGYAALTLDFSLWRGHRWAHLDCLFVQLDRRGQSIGGQLLPAAQSLAGSLGADRMEWQTPPWNEPAIRFYAAQGAQSSAKMRFSLVL